MVSEDLVESVRDGVRAGSVVARNFSADSDVNFWEEERNFNLTSIFVMPSCIFFLIFLAAMVTFDAVVW
jgi:hypothetical protein